MEMCVQISNIYLCIFNISLIKIMHKKLRHASLVENAYIIGSIRIVLAKKKYTQKKHLVFTN
jgi:hypothetical protein